MLSHYGWLMVYGNVDDPSVENHGSDVYIHKDDVVDGESLCPGDIVKFYLYVDDMGLGAEMCQVERKAASRMRMNPRVCLSSMPEMFEAVSVDSMTTVFLRLSRAFSSCEGEDEDEYDMGKPWNAKFLPSSDDSACGGSTIDFEKEEDEELEETTDSEMEYFLDVERKVASAVNPPVCLSSMPAMFEPVDVDNVATVFLRLSKAFSSCEDDDEDEYDMVKPLTTKYTPLSDDSTCGGSTIDSEEEEEASDSENILSDAEAKVGKGQP